MTTRKDAFVDFIGVCHEKVSPLFLKTMTVELKMFEQSRKGKPNADQELSQEAKQLLESLDLTVQPVETAKHIPRIVNKMAALWNKPIAMDNYFMELMIDHRGTRNGFPPRVAAEIAALQEYYSTIVYPKTSRDVWDKGDQ